MNVSRFALAALALFAVGFTCATAATTPTTLKIDLKAENGSGETGTATITQESDGVKVDIALKNAPAAAQPAHIHPGTCANLTPAPKWPLTSVINGSSTTELKGVTIAQLLADKYAVNVHKSTTDLATYVACGNIAS
ncbi:MAG TPA: hypothetical protein VMF61_08390 [Candidatus Acidoferrales bacterium]|nr:hypothetical protein [Candidatus Acidoferrales bacterium]